MAHFPDLENELIEWIPTVSVGTTADTVTGDVLDASLPFARVTHTGGPRDGITSYSRFDIEAFATTRAVAIEVLEDVLDALQPRARLVSAIIDNVRIEASPHKLSWDNDKVRRFLATVQISARR